VELRTSLWRQQFVLTTLALVIIYPSEHLYGVYQANLTYYLYLCGLYHAPSQDYEDSIRSYLFTLIVLLFERVCLSWYSGRFGCDDEVYNIIKSFQ
jgi:hypothetical protein